MQELEITRGDVFNLPLAFTDETDTDTPVAFDLTGYTVFFTVKNRWDNAANDDNAVIKKSNSIHDDAANGLTSFDLSASETNQLIEDFKADIQIVDGSGNVQSSEVFTVKFVNDVTKRTS